MLRSTNETHRFGAGGDDGQEGGGIEGN